MLLMWNGASEIDTDVISQNALDGSIGIQDILASFYFGGRNLEKSSIFIFSLSFIRM